MNKRLHNLVKKHPFCYWCNKEVFLRPTVRNKNNHDCATLDHLESRWKKIDIDVRDDIGQKVKTVLSCHECNHERNRYEQYHFAPKKVKFLPYPKAYALLGDTTHNPIPAITIKQPEPMNRPQFREHIAKTFAGCLSLVDKKNADYAQDGDPFKNFKGAELVGLRPDQAMLLHIANKLSRIANLIDQEQVLNESVEDSIDDGINYLAILKAYLSEQKKPKRSFISEFFNSK